MISNSLNSRKTTIPVLICILMSFTLYAQDSSDADQAAALAKETANPIANLISIPIQANFNFGTGDYDRTRTLVNIQPVIPFRLSSNINVINRIIIPIMYQPDNAESGGTGGIGNINYSMFFTPKASGNFTWGIGPAFNIPTLTDDKLGANAFGIGPTAIALLMLDKMVFGATFNRLWSYNGSDVNSFFGQYFITYNLKNAWYINTNPNIVANFNAPDGEQWTVPFGVGGGKVTHFGSRPVKLQAQYYYNAIRPEGGAKSTLQITMVFLFPPKPKG